MTEQKIVRVSSDVVGEVRSKIDYHGSLFLGCGDWETITSVVQIEDFGGCFTLGYISEASMTKAVLRAQKNGLNIMAFMMATSSEIRLPPQKTVVQKEARYHSKLDSYPFYYHFRILDNYRDTVCVDIDRTAVMAVEMPSNPTDDDLNIDFGWGDKYLRQYRVLKVSVVPSQQTA